MIRLKKFTLALLVLMSAKIVTIVTSFAEDFVQTDRSTLANCKNALVQIENKYSKEIERCKNEIQLVKNDSSQDGGVKNLADISMVMQKISVITNNQEYFTQGKTYSGANCYTKVYKDIVAMKSGLVCDHRDPTLSKGFVKTCNKKNELMSCLNSFKHLNFVYENRGIKRIEGGAIIQGNQLYLKGKVFVEDSNREYKDFMLHIKSTVPELDFPTGSSR